MDKGPEFYRKWYYRDGDGGASIVSCGAAEATRVEIAMNSLHFASSLFHREFALPSQADEAKEYERMLRRAFDLGREHEADRVAQVLDGLLHPRNVS